MALHGSQKKFDKNKDGKLSAGEWQSWYFATYGVDMEREERQKKAQETASWNDRLGQMMYAARRAAESVLGAAQRLLPNRADAKELAWKAMLCQITAALKEGTEWKIAWKTHVGQMVSNSVVYPVQAVARDLMEVSGLFAPKEAQRMALPCRVLFQEEGELAQARPCGTFWREVILRLPPYDKEHPPKFRDGSLSLTLPADEPGENDALENALIDLLDGMFQLTTFFGDAESADHDLRENRMLSCFCGHWQQIRGTYVNFSDSGVRRMAEQNPALYDVWGVEELSGMYSHEVLEELYPKRPELAIALWRSLAEKDQPFTDPEEMEDFLSELDWLWQSEGEELEQLRPLVKALKEDEEFIWQLYCGPVINACQWTILKGAMCCGEPELAGQLFALLEEHPLGRENAPCSVLEERIYRSEPELTIAIWRFLAGTDEPLDDPEEARHFLDGMEWLWQAEYENGDAELLQPLLDELQRDDSFARQICQSAYVNYYQQSLIMAAADCRRFALAEHLFSLLMENPLPRDRWDLDFEELRELAEKLGLTADERGAEPENGRPRDDTEYVYCKVHIPGVRRDYSYLAGELPLHVGDWVEVPFGRKDTVKRGRVVSVARYTRRTAPWPPEKTKTVLGMAEQPAEDEAVEKEPVLPEKEEKPKTPAAENPEERTGDEPENEPEEEQEEEPKDEHPQDDTEYVYCTVYVPGACRDYAYLAGEFSLHVGDWVKVPFGMENVVKRGKVTSVTRCTRQTAPWPPEQTKTVLCMTEQPTEFEVVETEPVPPEKGGPNLEIKPGQKIPPERKKPFPYRNILTILLIITVCAGGPALVIHRTNQKNQQYEAAVQMVIDGDYTAAERSFLHIGDYRDAKKLASYCEYADIYRTRDDYAGGDMLEDMTLQYEKKLRGSIDSLAFRIRQYRAEKDDAAARQKEEERKAAYSDKLPKEGMPMSALKYTSLGQPDEIEKCRFFDELVEDHRSYTVRWYRDDGTLLAAGHCFKGKTYDEYTLISFTIYNEPTAPSGGGTGGAETEDHSYSIRDEYSSPEDYWEDNRDLFDDEDEAWDE